MPFKVFNFPLSVRRQIAKKMKLLDVLNFSFCSSKTKTTTKETQENAFVSIRHFCFRSDTGSSYEIVMDNDETYTYLTVRFNKVEESQVEKFGKPFKLVIGKDVVTCCMSIISREKVVFYFNGSTIQDVHQEVYDLIDHIHISAPPKHQITTSFRKNETNPTCGSPGESECSCCLTKSRNANEIAISARNSENIIKSSFLDYVFLAWPNLQVAHIYGLIDSRIKKDCYLFDVKELRCDDLGPMVYRIMAWFRGQHLYLKTVLTTEAVISYLKHWTSGRKHQNIQTLGKFY